MERAYKRLLDRSFSLNMNANDFFGFACADAVEVDPLDLDWIIPVVEKYGNDGLNACLCYIRQQLCLENYHTKEMFEALFYISQLNPKVMSELGSNYDRDYTKGWFPIEGLHYCTDLNDVMAV